MFLKDWLSNYRLLKLELLIAVNHSLDSFLQKEHLIKQRTIKNCGQPSRNLSFLVKSRKVFEWPSRIMDPQVSLTDPQDGLEPLEVNKQE